MFSALHAFSTPSGWVVGWGNNISGNVTGIPYSGFSTGVVTIAGQVLTNAVAIAAGRGHALALRSDGTVAGWGNNYSGQATGIKSTFPPYRASGVVTIDGQALSNAAAISACQFSAALKVDGTVAVWGLDGSGYKFNRSDLTNAVAVNAGEDHCLVLKKDGTLFSLDAGGVTPLGVSNVVAMATGRSYVTASAGSDLALKMDGAVVGLYAGRIEEGSYLKKITNIITIEVSGMAAFALTKDGRVFGMGINDRGQSTGVPTTNYIASGFVSIGGQFLTNITAIASAGDCSYALKKDGTVVAWGKLGSQPASVPAGLSNVVAIAAGNNYCLAITTNRAVADKFRQ